MTLTFVQKSQEIYWEMLKQPSFELGGCRLIDTGVASPWLNGVVASRTSFSLEAVVDYFAKRKLPFSWWMDLSEEPANFAEEMAKFGAECHGIFDGMILDLDKQTIPKGTAPLAIRRVLTDEDLRQFVDVLVLAYESDSTVAPGMEKILQTGGMIGPIFHFLGFEEGEVVTAGSLFICEQMAGIYHIGTVPHARGRGYATSLMQSILQFAKEKGCKSSFLTSTPMANGIYQRLGYEPVSKFHLYMR
jgi:GNAT superfamily N-acetyltransferase